MSDEKKPSLADQLKAKKEAEKKAESLADKLGAKKVEKDAPASLADQLGAKKLEKDAAASLADQLGVKKSGRKRPSLADKMQAQAAKGVKQPLADKLQAVAKEAPSAVLDAEALLALTSQVTSLKTEYKTMIGRVNLSSLASETAGLGTTITALPSAIKGIRDRGYIFRSYLENKAEVLKAEWAEIDDDIESWIDNESAALKEDLERAEALVEEIDSEGEINSRVQKPATQLTTVLEYLGEKVRAAETHVQEQYDSLQQEVHQMNRQMNEINWFLEQQDEASFSPQAGESLFLVAEAEWDDGNDKPDGNLFLTDQRLLFEQKEKVGKRLGMFGGKEVQDVLWEAPINTVEKAEAENKGLLGGKDMIYLTFGSGAPYAQITLEVKGSADCKFWAKQITRMVSGDANDERAIEPDADLIERLRNAPTECHVCSGTLPQLMSGQTQIACDYCGAVVRI